MSETITFPTETKALNMKEMDALVEQLRLAEEAYKTAKAESTRLDAERNKVRNEILEQLELSGMKSFKSNFGTVTSVVKLSYQTPKTTEAKEKFFNYIKENHGEDSFKALQTVNSRSLNSFLNEVGATEVDGLEPPVENTTLSFRRG